MYFRFFSLSSSCRYKKGIQRSVSLAEEEAKGVKGKSDSFLGVVTEKESKQMQGLEGVKVLELGSMVSAAYATKLMADLGADVIKVEEPIGDRARQRGPFPGGIVDLEKSGLFLSLNTNKRGITLDLGQEKEQLSHLIAWADILVHN